MIDANSARNGEAVLDDLSRRLTADFGKGFTTTNLKYMRSFYVAFPIRHALRDESDRARKRNAVRSELSPDLSWTHYQLPLGVGAEPRADVQCHVRSGNVQMLPRTGGARLSEIPPRYRPDRRFPPVSSRHEPCDPTM
jgi:hypothetical protein